MILQFHYSHVIWDTYWKGTTGQIEWRLQHTRVFLPTEDHRHWGREPRSHEPPSAAGKWSRSRIRGRERHCGTAAGFGRISKRGLGAGKFVVRTCPSSRFLPSRVGVCWDCCGWPNGPWSPGTQKRSISAPRWTLGWCEWKSWPMLQEYQNRAWVVIRYSG